MMNTCCLFSVARWRSRASALLEDRIESKCRAGQYAVAAAHEQDILDRLPVDDRDWERQFDLALLANALGWFSHRQWHRTVLGMIGPVIVLIASFTVAEDAAVVNGAVTATDLVKNALRMRPERIIIGECRGPETLDMLQAMNTGHDGSLTTLHANTPRDALARMETLVLMAGMDAAACFGSRIASGASLGVTSGIAGLSTADNLPLALLAPDSFESVSLVLSFFLSFLSFLGLRIQFSFCSEIGIITSSFLPPVFTDPAPDITVSETNSCAPITVTSF